MRRLLFGCFFWLISLGTFSSSAYSQLQSPTCNANVPKLFFTGKAPLPWAIDGEVIDWETILGSGSGNAFNYYNPPAASGFNWSFDGTHLGQNIGLLDADHPEPKNDLRFMSFIHDDYNVYFYFRRMKKTNDPSTFFYFCDVNADGFMNLGEPVFKATFSSNFISAISLCVYIPNPAIDFVTNKGNIMYNGCTVDGYSMKGTIVELFNSSSIPSSNTLTINEIFSVKVTENGLGVEFAIPWKYLKNWNLGSAPLLPGYIFFYHTSLQPGVGPYQENLVADNAGSCPANRGPLYKQDLGMSGPADFYLQSGSFTSLANAQSYRFKLKFKNSTSATELIQIGESVIFKNITAFPGSIVNEQQFSVNIYVDKNCNGIIDPGETPTNYVYEGGTFFQQPISYSDPSQFFSPAISTLGFGDACFIIDVSLPPNGSVRSFEIEFRPRTLFDLPNDCFLGSGGKPINPIGYTIITEEGSINRSIDLKKENNEHSQIFVFPNPSSGNSNVLLPNEWGETEIVIEDYTGRLIKKIIVNCQKKIAIDNLKSGLYLINIRSLDGKNHAVRKLIIL